MEDLNKAFETIKTEAIHYADNRLKLLKLEATEKVSKLVGRLFIALLAVAFCFFIVIFLSIMAGDWFATLLGSRYQGFAVVAGIYVVMLVFIVTAGRRLVKNFLISRIIKMFLDKPNK